ncbi:MAG: c-type cytochrome biogenesis protein CcmI [Rhodospirillales bacterium]
MTLVIATIALAVVVIAILCVPLLGPRRFGEQRPQFDIGVYRDQLRELERDIERGLLNPDQAGQARAEIERRLLAADARRQAGSGYRGSRKATAMVLLAAPLIPAAAVALYTVLGTPDLPDMPYAERPDVVPEMSDTDIADAIGRLEDRLRTSPDDAEGWALLGHSLATVGRFADARDALMRAYELTKDPYLRADAAEAAISAKDNVIGAADLAAFEALHATDPFEPKSRFYIGLAALQDGRTVDAMQEWIDLIVVSPVDAPWLDAVRQQVLGLADETGTDVATLKPSDEALALAQSASAMPSPSAEDIRNAEDMTPEERMAFIRSMVERLAERLEANPDDREGWLRLARAYEVLGETEKAASALERAQAVR